MKIEEIIKRLDEIIDYPPEGHGRRRADGYPDEVVYDEFAYKRMCDSYRVALKQLKSDIIVGEVIK